MEAVREDEGPGSSSHSDEEEDGEDSSDEEAIASEREGVAEPVGPEQEASTEDHGLGATTRGSNLDHGGRGETAITSLSFGNEPMKENGRSSTGSGVPSVARSVSVETGLRKLKVSEGNAPERGERTLGVCFVNSRARRLGFNVVEDYSDGILRFVNPTGHTRDHGDKVEEADLESDRDSRDDSAEDEAGTERHVTSARIKERVATEVAKDKKRQRKYHTKKSGQRSKGGRAKGSKSKESVKQQVASAGWF